MSVFDPQFPESGQLKSYPPVEQWDDWTEYDPDVWPKKVTKNYMLVPTVCFNCEAACGLLAYVDKEDMRIRKFRRQSGASRKPRPELRQGSGDHQPSARSGAHSLPHETHRSSWLG